jgi:hypothetical protein
MEFERAAFTPRLLVTTLSREFIAGAFRPTTLFASWKMAIVFYKLTTTKTANVSVKTQGAF